MNRSYMILPCITNTDQSGLFTRKDAYLGQERYLSVQVEVVNNSTRRAYAAGAA
jgi:hypothetical protein